jgi:hypothetical protein
MRFPRATAVEAAKRRLFGLVVQVSTAPSTAGSASRPHLEELAFLPWANARILQAARAAEAPRDARRRYLAAACH